MKVVVFSEKFDNIGKEVLLNFKNVEKDFDKVLVKVFRVVMEVDFEYVFYCLVF